MLGRWKSERKYFLLNFKGRDELQRSMSWVEFAVRLGEWKKCENKSWRKGKRFALKLFERKRRSVWGGLAEWRPIFNVIFTLSKWQNDCDACWILNTLNCTANNIYIETYLAYNLRYIHDPNQIFVLNSLNILARKRRAKALKEKSDEGNDCDFHAAGMFEYYAFLLRSVCMAWKFCAMTRKRAQFLGRLRYLKKNWGNQTWVNVRGGSGERGEMREGPKVLVRKSEFFFFACSAHYSRYSEMSGWFPTLD